MCIRDRNLHRMYKTKSFDDNRSRAVPMERSRTIDMAEAKDLNELARTPDFQRMVYQNWKAHHRKKTNFRKRGWNGKIFEHGADAFDSDRNYPDNGNTGNSNNSSNSGSSGGGGLFANFSKYVDIKSGSLNFAGKLSLSSKGIDFSNGSSSVSYTHLDVYKRQPLETRG